MVKQISCAKLSNRQRKDLTWLRLAIAAVPMPAILVQPIIFILLGMSGPAATATLLVTFAFWLAGIGYGIHYWWVNVRPPSHLPDFARDNNWKRVKNPDNSSLQLSAKVFSHDFKIHEVLEIPIGRRKIHLFRADSIYFKSLWGQLTRRQTDENQAIEEITFLELPLPAAMPRIFVDSNKNNQRSKGISAHDTFTKLGYSKLEGDFATIFDVYIPDQYEIEALSVLEPELMQILIDELGDFDFEIVGEYFYIIDEGRVDDKQTLERWLTVAPKIMAVIEDSVKRNFTKIPHYEPDLELRPHILHARRRADSRRIIRVGILTAIVTLVPIGILIYTELTMTANESLRWFYG